MARPVCSRPIILCAAMSRRKTSDIGRPQSAIASASSLPVGRESLGVVGSNRHPPPPHPPPPPPPAVARSSHLSPSASRPNSQRIRHIAHQRPQKSGLIEIAQLEGLDSTLVATPSSSTGAQMPPSAVLIGSDRHAHRAPPRRLWEPSLAQGKSQLRDDGNSGYSAEAAISHCAIKFAWPAGRSPRCHWQRRHCSSSGFPWRLGFEMSPIRRCTASSISGLMKVEGRREWIVGLHAWDYDWMRERRTRPQFDALATKLRIKNTEVTGASLPQAPAKCTGHGQ